MAEKPAAEPTEKPTSRRLSEARKEGQVPQSEELKSVVSIAVLTASVVIVAPDLMEWLTIQVREGMLCDNAVVSQNQAFVSFLSKKLIGSVIIMLPILAALCVGSVMAGVVVSGFNLSANAVRLKTDTLNPISGLGKLVGARSIVKLLLSVFKLSFISIIVWYYLRDKTEAMAAIRWAWSGQILFKTILGLMVRVCIGLVIIALIDVVYQKWKYIEDLKMTKQQVKEERRDIIGSPEVRKKIRQLQLEMTMKRMLAEVPKANVVLVNPEHVAVALRYDAKTMEAPSMVAKGAEELAEKIREIARAYGIPIIRRPELARTIYSTVKPGEAIPPSLYIAVAEVLALIYRLRNKK